jgi:poly-gamma-glutamate capsule biosynthesis protein CapA/YwtB (metallophosphatase superfamily)
VAEMGQVRLCLTGDVMTGRGVDQILAHPSDPTISEMWSTSADDYVSLAESRSGPLPRRVPPTYIWGELLEVLHDARIDTLVANLETAVTDQGSPWPGKGIQYRMHPDNVDCLSVAGIDVAVLANNHVLDWSTSGLEQTLDAVGDAGIATVGAGRSVDEAWTPARVDTPTGSRVIVIAAGVASSGIPSAWAARTSRPGVAFLANLTDDEVTRLARIVDEHARPGDVVVASLHWGGNWGYEIADEHRRFAQALIDRAGVHVVHGHSSHHPLGIEVYDGHPIIYGCGDLINDYEGISGHEAFRGDLGALYLVDVDATTGIVDSIELVPTRVHRFQLVRPSPQDVEWLGATLGREGASLGVSVEVGENDRLHLRW